jgi:histidine ammonia-lyase
MQDNLIFPLNGDLKLSDLAQFVFQRSRFGEVQISEKLLEKSEKTHIFLQNLIKKGTPIYGVTTGFGDSCTRYVDQDLTLQLQKNLINYLSCGQGDFISVEASRAMFVIRLNSLCQGYSAVSAELLQHMALLLSHDVLPVVPQEGSLGASGDLIPLAYLGQLVQGQGQAFHKGQLVNAADVFQKLRIKPYELKAKEGLAIVNGTSTMAGVMLVNLKLSEHLLYLSELASSWQCLVLNGKREAFSPFINEVAKTNPGQSLVAKNVSRHLDAEKYFPNRGQDVQVGNLVTNDFVQDRYSIRCVPQILGPIQENLQQSWANLQHEINSITDNPLISDEGSLEMGGNFYGGYLCQSMDFMKINLAHMADLADRQVAMLIDTKSNRGLPDNLVYQGSLSDSERNIHHGLKGLHQATSAITSEVIQKSIPSGIFSRSSESHNQDKVSLGMSAATSCGEMLKGLYKISALKLVCLAQAIDLKKIKLQGDESLKVYNQIRRYVPFVERDMSLGQQVFELTEDLKKQALHG